MKNFTRTMLLLALAIGIGTAGSGNVLSENLLFSSRLSGEQEVPPVETDAMGVGSYFLNETRDTLCLRITATGLSGPIQAAHIHSGAMGENGPVILGFDNAIKGNNIEATVTGSDLTPELLAMMFEGTLYFNIHTAMHPSGEIRGQIMLETDRAFRAMLNTEQETHDASGMGTGLATFNLSQMGNEVALFAVFDMLTGPVTMVHLHEAPMGQDGPVVVDLGPFLSGNMLMGSFDPTAQEGLLEAMRAGNIYINVHTAQNPAGEIRGQLMLENDIVFDALIDTEQEIPAPVDANGNGLALISLNHTLDTLRYDIQASMLSGPITMAHFHEGAAGVNGGVLIGLDDDIMGNRISGFAAGSELTPELINKFLSGNVYINVHTALNPAGEIRGQVYKLAREGYTLSPDGMQEVPMVETMGSGNGLVSVDRNQRNAHFMFAYNDLSGPATMAHFHMGAAGENGPVIFDLGDFLVQNGTSGYASGYWSDMDMMPFGSESATAFRDEMVYLNVHTAMHPGGKIRGQVSDVSACSMLPLSTNIFQTQEEGLTVYPNPASFTTIIAVKDAPSGNYTLTVVDIAGRTVLQRNMASGQIANLEVPVADLRQGMYLIRLEGAGRVYSTKLVRE